MDPVVVPLHFNGCWTRKLTPESLRPPKGNRRDTGRDCAGHYFLQRGLELIHLGSGAYRDAHVGRPDRPDAADVHVLLGHGVDDLFASALGVEHEAVGL
jgi:hypothetical protein